MPALPSRLRSGLLVLLLSAPLLAHASPSGAGLIPVSWTDSVAAVPDEAEGAYDTAASHVRPVIYWTEAQFARVPALYEEGKDLVLNGIGRLRGMSIPSAPNFAGTRSL